MHHKLGTPAKLHKIGSFNFNYPATQVFFKEKVRYPVWTCRDPIYLILGTRFEILGTLIGSLKHLKKPAVMCLIFFFLTELTFQLF